MPPIPAGVTVADADAGADDADRVAAADLHVQQGRFALPDVPIFCSPSFLAVVRSYLQHIPCPRLLVRCVFVAN